MDPSNSLLQVVCCPQETLGSFMYRVFDNDFVYKCTFNNQVLDDNSKLLTEYGIKDGSIIYLAFCNDMGFQNESKTFHLNNHWWKCEWRQLRSQVDKSQFVATETFVFLFSLSLCFQSFSRKNHSLPHCRRSARLCVQLCVSLFIFYFASFRFPHSIYGARQNNKFQIANRGEWIYGCCGNF